MIELLVAYGMVPVRPAGAPADAGLATHAAAGGPCPRIGLRGEPMSGKSFATVGLAVAWANAGTRVLIVDLGNAQDVSRLLRVGSAVEAPGGRRAGDLLTALRRGRLADPADTLLPNVDILAGGTTSEQQGSALAELLHRRPAALRTQLDAASRGYDRVIIDGPSEAGPIQDGIETSVDLVVRLAPFAADPGAPGRDGPPVLLSRWRPDRDPGGSWVARFLRRGGALDTVLPDFNRVDDPWQIVCGEAEPRVYAAFRALAVELDARWKIGQPGGVT